MNKDRAVLSNSESEYDEDDLLLSNNNTFLKDGGRFQII